jgi:hypothetical protein
MIELKITEFAVNNSHSLNHSFCPDITDIWFMYRYSVLILRTYDLCTVDLSWYYGHMIYVQLLCPDITDIWFMNICSVPISQTSHSCTVVLSWYYGHMMYVHCSVLISPTYHSCTFVLFCPDITDIWFRYLCSIICLYVLSSVLWCPLRFMHNRVRLYLQLYVGGLMSYLCYLRVLHILVSSTSWIYD